jgi:transposase-like protein
VKLGEGMARPRTPKTPFYRFNSSPEIIRLVVMMYVKFPLSLRNVEDLLHERGIDICHGHCQPNGKRQSLLDPAST